jgi:Bacterial protein of unknown function (DUF899)
MRKRPSKRLPVAVASRRTGHDFEITKANEEANAMTDRKVGTREEWLAARNALLEQENEYARRSEELAQQRRELPWVRVENEQRSEADEHKTLAELFDGRSQLLLHHFILDPTVERWPEDNKCVTKAIDAEAGQPCSNSQQLLTWNQQGPAGISSHESSMAPFWARRAAAD